MENKHIKVIENTKYGLLLSLLILKKLQNVEFIFPIYFDAIILKNLNRLNLNYKISQFGSFNKGIIRHYIQIFKYHILKYKKDKNIVVYGNDHLDIAIPYRKYNFNLIEDGLLNYTFFKYGYIRSGGDN